jgi:hypothetical protein
VKNYYFKTLPVKECKRPFLEKITLAILLHNLRNMYGQKNFFDEQKTEKPPDYFHLKFKR